MSCWLLCPSSNLDESRITETLANNGIVSRLKWAGWTYSAILYCQWLSSVPSLDRLRDSPVGKEPRRKSAQQQSCREGDCEKESAASTIRRFFEQ
jgi:hypothetical protein